MRSALRAHAAKLMYEDPELCEAVAATRQLGGVSSVAKLVRALSRGR